MMSYSQNSFETAIYVQMTDRLQGPVHDVIQSILIKMNFRILMVQLYAIILLPKKVSLGYVRDQNS